MPSGGVNQLGKTLQHINHFVAAFPAAYVNHQVSVGPFSKLLLSNRLARAESSWDRSATALGDREESVNYPLSRDEGIDGGSLRP